MGKERIESCKYSLINLDVVPLNIGPKTRYYANCKNEKVADDVRNDLKPEDCVSCQFYKRK